MYAMTTLEHNNVCSETRKAFSSCFHIKDSCYTLTYEEYLMRAIHLKIISTCGKQYNCPVIPSKNYFL